MSRFGNDIVAEIRLSDRQLRQDAQNVRAVFKELARNAAQDAKQVGTKVGKPSDDLNLIFDAVRARGARSFDGYVAGAEKAGKSIRGTADETKKFRDLIRRFGTSSGIDPFLNAIGSFGIQAAAALATTKALTIALESASRASDFFAAKRSGNLERQIKAEQDLRNLLTSIPIAGPLGGAIRDFADRNTRDQIENTKQATEEQEKQNKARQEHIDLQRLAREEAEQITRATNREIELLKKSPRVKEIREAEHALEDYRREVEKVTQQTGRPITQEQREAIDALQRKVDAIKNKRGTPGFSDVVQSAQQAQLAILNSEEWGAKRRVDVVKREEAEKRKEREKGARKARETQVDLTPGEAREQAKRLRDKIRQLRPAAESGDASADRAVRAAEAQVRRLQDIQFAGSVNRGSTLRAIERERVALRGRLNRPGVTDAERDAEMLAFESRSRRRLRFSDRAEFNRGLDQLQGVLRDERARRGIPDSDRKLDKAADKLDQAGEKLSKTETIGVIRR